MEYEQGRRESTGDYEHRIRTGRTAGKRGRTPSSYNSPVNSTKKPFYYSGRSYEPELTRAETVMKSIDIPLAVVEPFISLILLAYIPALGLLNCAMTASYLGSRMYHRGLGKQIGKPIDDFLVSTWQKFSQPRK